MTNRIKKLIAIVPCMLLTGIFAAHAAYADEVNIAVFGKDDRTTVSGSTGAPGGTVSVSVFNKGADYGEVENMEDGALVYANQLTADSNGNFSFVLNFGGRDTGEYAIRVYCGGKQVAAKRFPYSTSEDNKTAIEKLNDAVRNGTAAEFIKNNKTALEFSSDYDGKISEDKAAATVAAAAPFDTDDKITCANAYKQAMLIAAVSDGKVTDLDELKTLDMMSQSPLKETYAAKYITNDVKSNALSRLTGTAYASFEDFNGKLCDAIVLAVTKHPTGYGDIASSASALCSRIPSSILTANACRSVAQHDYPTIDALIQALSAATGSSGGGASGGGSGGGSGVPFPAVSDGKPTTSPSPTAPIEITSGFNDIGDYGWAKEAIESLSAKGIIAGKGGGKFCPGESITREEFIKLAVLLFDISQGSGECTFEDAVSDAWYYPYIKTAYTAGVINGISSDTFGLGMQITRQDAAVIIGKCISAESEEDKKAEFSDMDEISDYAAEAVKRMYALGIINGYEDGSFRPKNSITRAEAAKILYGAAGLKK